MKKLLLSGILITGLIVANPAGVFADSHQRSSCAKCEAKTKKCKISRLKKKVKQLWFNKEALGIAEKQLEKIKDIKHAAIKELIRLKADKDIVKVDLKSAMWDESIDVGAVNKLIDAKYAAKTKAAKTYVKALRDIQKVLSKEQRAKWKEMSIKAKLAGGKICPITGKPLDK